MGANSMRAQTIEILWPSVLVLMKKRAKIRVGCFLFVKCCEIGKLHLLLCSVLVPVRNPRPKRVMNNVLTRMQNFTGPLSVLSNCMERRVRIKVRAQGFLDITSPAFAGLKYS